MFVLWKHKNKTDKLLSSLIKEKKKGRGLKFVKWEIKKKRKEVTTDYTEIPRIIRDYY